MFVVVCFDIGVIEIGGVCMWFVLLYDVVCYGIVYCLEDCKKEGIVVVLLICENIVFVL